MLYYYKSYYSRADDYKIMRAHYVNLYVTNRELRENSRRRNRRSELLEVVKQGDLVCVSELAEFGSTKELIVTLGKILQKGGIVHSYKEGLEIGQGDSLGKAVELISKALENFGKMTGGRYRKPLKRGKLSDKDRQKIAKMYMNGYSQTDIAKEFSVTQMTISRVVSGFKCKRKRRFVN